MWNHCCHFTRSCEIPNCNFSSEIIFQAVISRLLWDSKVSFLACCESKLSFLGCHFISFLSWLWTHYWNFSLKIVVQYLLPFAILVQIEFLQYLLCRSFYTRKIMAAMSQPLSECNCLFISCYENLGCNCQRLSERSCLFQLLRESWLPFISHSLRDVHAPAFFQLLRESWLPFISHSLRDVHAPAFSQL